VLDIVIENGLVIDGTGRPGEKGTVAVRDGKIVAVGRAPVGEARRRLDASGMVVTPGFVDPHSHTDYTVHTNRDAQSTVRQGVTTEVVGNCGITNAPVSELSRRSVANALSIFGYDQSPSWSSFGEYLSDVEAGGTSQNLAWLVGHSAIRAAVGIRGQLPTEGEMSAMEDYVEEAMQAGALGMSTGLEFREGRLATTQEILRLASVVARHDGFYVSHIRNRDAAILDAVTEFLNVTELSGAHGQISHLNVRYDTGAPPRAWEQAVGLMEASRARGNDVQADMTPFRYGLGDMCGILPPWLLENGPARAAEMLADGEVRQRAAVDSDRYWRFIHKGQWHRVSLHHSLEFAEYDGMVFPDIAARRKVDEWNCFFDILQAAGEAMEHLEMVGELFLEEDLADQLRHPLFSCGVDAYTSSLADSTAGCSPLSFSGHVEYLAVHVRQNRTVSLEEMVRKLTSLPATRFGLKGRGKVAPGYAADLVVFDPATIASASTFANPAVYPTGIPFVLVNGRLVVDQGLHTGNRPGQVLRRAA
jgi:N-acyl-D-amino-acid deacylase